MPIKLIVLYWSSSFGDSDGWIVFTILTNTSGIRIGTDAWSFRISSCESYRNFQEPLTNSTISRAVSCLEHFLRDARPTV